MAVAETPPPTPPTPPPSPAAPPPAAPSVDDLRGKIDAAQHALDQAKADLAKQQDKDRLEAEIDGLVTAYAGDYQALKAGDAAARAMLAAETKCLREILTPQVADQIPAIVAEERKTVTDLALSIAQREGELADKRAALAAAIVRRDAAKKALDTLKKPAAAIKDRLKTADGFKADLKKAHDAGDYAIAYWLLIDAQKFAGALDGAPPLLSPDELGAAIRDAWNDLAAAQAEVDALDAAVKAAAKALDDDKARLAALAKSTDTRIRQRLAALTPPHAEAA